MNPKHLTSELYFVRHSRAREQFIKTHKEELQKYVSMLGDESKQAEIESLRTRIVQSCYGPDGGISVSLDVLNFLERNFLLQEIRQESNKTKHSKSIELSRRHYKLSTFFSALIKGVKKFSPAFCSLIFKEPVKKIMNGGS